MKTGILGAISMAVYCISTALSAVWVMVAFTRISGAALTFITFLMAWAVFFLVHTLRGHDPFRLLREEWRGVLLLNVLTLFSWWLMFMALQRIEASVESAIYQAGCRWWWWSAKCWWRGPRSVVPGGWARC